VQQQSTASSIYHALQAKLERRLSSGTSFLATYTWSKSIDTASGIGTGQDDRPQDSYNIDAERAVSNFDIPHRFVFSSTFALPFGKNQPIFSGANGVLGFLISDWQTNGIVTWQSGQPFNVLVGSFDGDSTVEVRDSNGVLTRRIITRGTQISNRRPNLVGNPFENVPTGFAFNPAAFAVPGFVVTSTVTDPNGVVIETRQNLLGNVGRNTIRGGKYFNTDFGVLRTFALPFLGENRNLQFRAEFFNVFNNVNFTRPVQNLSSPAFGRYASNATLPRVIQFGFKFNF
jgi:hypothetical protein